MHVRDKRKRRLALLLNFALYLFALPFRLLRLLPVVAPDEPRSFLIVRLEKLGDLILSTPVYRSLKERFPNAHIAVLCGPWGAGVLANNPFVDSIMTLDCPWWSSVCKDARSAVIFLRELFSTIRSIRLRRFDVFIDLRGDTRHIFLFGWLTGIPLRISNTRSGGGFLLTDPVPYTPGRHEIELSYNLLRRFEPIAKYHKTQVRSCYEDFSSAQRKVGSVDGQPFAVVFNGGASPLRRLSIPKTAELCSSLYRQFGLQTFYVGDGYDFHLGEEVERFIGDRPSYFHNICGLVNLMELRELICKANVFIGTDSSVAQLSASTDVASVSLFGPVDPCQSRPIGPNKIAIHHKYPCCPCLQERCAISRSGDSARCMDDISVDEIIGGIRQLVNP